MRTHDPAPVSPREIRSLTHGRLTEEIPWAESFSRVTYRFEYLMLRYCKIMTQKAAAELLGIAKSTLSDLLHRSISRIRQGHRIRDRTTLDVDEISYRKGHKYAVKSRPVCKTRRGAPRSFGWAAWATSWVSRSDRSR